MLVLEPGFGAEYKTAEEILEAWQQDREFVVVPDGCFLSRTQLEAEGRHGEEIWLTFRGRRSVVILEPSVTEPGILRNDGEGEHNPSLGG